MSFGVFGHPELIVREPLSPKEIMHLIYDKCLPYDPVEAVLQQEVRNVYVRDMSVCVCGVFAPFHSF